MEVRHRVALQILITACLGWNSHALFAQADGYYKNVDNSSPQAMRNSLHEIIDDHQRYPYTSSATDTWDILEIADENQDNSVEIITIYRNASYPKQGGGNDFYNREHIWPKSYGFPDDNSRNYPYTDMHALFLADDGYNSSRSNHPYDYCSPNCSQKPTQANNGRGGEGGGYPGDSNWRTGSNTFGKWEVWNGRRGDAARALLYMDVRYEGGTHGITGADEPDLILTDDVFLIDDSNTGNNEAVGYMGKLSTLLEWHRQDPVDWIEFQHHETVASFQGNRNPFIDHPEWVACVFEGKCTPLEINGGHTGAWFNPQTPGQGLLVDVQPSDQFIFLAWFTFTTGESEHPNEQHWFTAQGHYIGNQAVLTLHETRGGKFDDPQAVETLPVGEITLDFQDCNSGTVSYSINTWNQQGSFPIIRGIPGSEGNCEENSESEIEAVDINPDMSGAWYDLQTAGQGFLFDIFPDSVGGNFMFAAWFTFGEEAASGQKWLTAQGGFEGSTAELEVYKTTGGRFGNPQKVNTNRIGTLSIDFSDCNHAVLNYSLDDEGVDGEVSIIQALPKKLTLCQNQ